MLKIIEIASEMLKKEIFIIGESKVYYHFFTYTDCLYITKFNALVISNVFPSLGLT